ncbi:MAG: polysaccharide deacetylase family protein [Pseudomonadota bacterium]
MNKLPFISIVVITKDREKELKDLLFSLELQDYPKNRFEVIVISNKKIEINFGHLFISPPNMGFGKKRNLSLLKAKGEYIAFIDDDCYAPPNWLKTHLKSCIDNDAVAVGGSFLPYKPKIIGLITYLLGFPGKGAFRILQDEISISRSISTGNAFAKSKQLSEIGGFKDNLIWGGEDQDLFARLNSVYKTIINPNNFVFHRQRENIFKIFQWFIRRGKSEYFRNKTTKSCISSLFTPRRRSITLKTLIVIFLTLIFKWPILLIIILLYYSIINLRIFKLLRKINNSSNIEIKDICNKNNIIIILSLAPLVKITMDIACEIGKYLAFYSDCKKSIEIFNSPIVLTFHKIGTAINRQNKNSFYIDTDNFQKIISFFIKKGYIVSSIKKHLKEKPKKSLILTFDDGYKNFFENAYPILKHKSINATIFIPSNFIGKTNTWETDPNSIPQEILSWDELNKLYANGIEIGSHTENHINLASEPDMKILQKEIICSKSFLQNNLKTEIISFALPYGGYSPHALSTLSDTYQFICTSVGGRWFNQAKFIKRISVSPKETTYSLYFKILFFTLKDFLRFFLKNQDSRFSI